MCIEVVLDLKSLFKTPNIAKAAITLTFWDRKLTSHIIFHHLERQRIVEAVKNVDLDYLCYLHDMSVNTWKRELTALDTRH